LRSPAIKIGRKKITMLVKATLLKNNLDNNK